MKIPIYFFVSFIFFLASCSEKNKDQIETEGIVEGTSSVVSSKVQADVFKIMKNEGEEIKAGDTIVILKSEYLKYQLQIAEANVLSAEAAYSLTLKGAREEDIRAAEENLKQAETNLSQAKVDLDRFEYLFQNKAISNKQYEDAQYRQKIAEAQYSAALEQLKKIKNLARPEEVNNAFSNLLKAKANLEIIKQNIKDCYIISPLEGFIEKIFVEKGESVSQMSKICKIIELKIKGFYLSKRNRFIKNTSKSIGKDFNKFGI